jgi:hypothetical protein
VGTQYPIEIGRVMVIYKSKPQTVEAMQWTGENKEEVLEFLMEKGMQDQNLLSTYRTGYPGGLFLLAGKDGAQGWVPVPVGHWLVHLQEDKTDIWPVDPDYFAAKYDPIFWGIKA